MTVKNGEHQTRFADIERQARLLAEENLRADPGIFGVLWFPDEHEVRILELDETVPACLDGQVHAFYFRPSPPDDLPSPSAVALIRPEERGKVELPPDWGRWEDAVLVGGRK